MTIERASLVSKIRQVIDNEILQYKHKLLDFGHEANIAMFLKMMVVVLLIQVKI